jgi:hypothetical protein
MIVLPYFCARQPQRASWDQRKEGTLMWMLQSSISSKRHAKRLPITLQVMRVKATETAKSLGITNSKAG